GQPYELDRGDRSDRGHEHLRGFASVGARAGLDRGSGPLRALLPGHYSADGGVSGEVGRVRVGWAMPIIRSHDPMISAYPTKTETALHRRSSRVAPAASSECPPIGGPGFETGAQG